jgi:SPP1 gp7 family putative phage head morphogenesis protein
MEAIVPMIQDVFSDTGKMAMKKLSQRKVKKQSMGMEYSFDLQNPRAIEFAERRAGELITQITEESRKAIQSTVVQALRGGGHPYEQAEQIRNCIGLTNRQAIAVDNYRKTLTMGESRSLKQINKMTETYANRLLDYRAKNIARTETLRAANEGQREAWRQATERSLIHGTELIREWIYTPDERSCPDCQSMDGKQAPINGLYENGISGPPLHPQCRCAEGLVETEEVQRVLEEAVFEPEVQEGVDIDYPMVNEELVGKVMDQEWVMSNFKTWAQDHDMSLDEYMKAAADQMKELNSQGNICIRVPGEDTLKKIFEDGRFKSQFETQSSKGFFDPNYRAEVEELLFKAPKDLPNEKRPIYGYLFDGSNKKHAEQYGNITIQLKRDKFQSRTTCTYGDSLNVGFAPRLLDEPHVAMSTTRDVLAPPMFSAKKTLRDIQPYPEVQIHGGVNTGGIEKIYFKETPSDGVIELLKNKEIPWEVDKGF